MTSFFPDVNVWLAVADDRHSHHQTAWSWYRGLPSDTELLLARYTQLAMLRLMTNRAVMGNQVRTTRQAWEALDVLLSSAGVEFCSEPKALDEDFRFITEPLADRSAPQWIGDCYLLAFAHASRSTLVTFDSALLSFAKQHGYAALRPE